MVTSHVSAKPQYFTLGSTFVQVDERAGLLDICAVWLKPAGDKRINKVLK